MTVILDDVKKYLGDSIDNSFDTELLVTIQGCLSNLVQVNVGKTLPFSELKTATWDTFFNDEEKDRGYAILYVCYKTKIAFDPPLPATMAAMSKSADEAFWRARLEFDT